MRNTLSTLTFFASIIGIRLIAIWAGIEIQDGWQAFLYVVGTVLCVRILYDIERALSKKVDTLP